MPLSNALDKVLITRTVGIEPTFTGLESVALPLYYARDMQRAVSHPAPSAWLSTL